MVERARFFDYAQLTDANGFVKKVANPEVTVYQNGTTTPYTGALYAAVTGSTELSNPFTGGADGAVEFYIETAGRVSIKYDGTAAGLGTATFDNQEVWPDPGQLNTTITSPSGTYAASMSDAGVFTAPGILRSMGVWNAADYGLVAGASSSLAAANKAALQWLFAEVCADDRPGKIVFPPGIWSLPNNVNLDHALGYSMSVHIEGMGGRATQLRLHGTSGPFLNWGSSTAGGFAFPSMKNLYIQHNDLVSTGGATIKLGSTAGAMLLEGVEISPGQVDEGGIGTNGALIGLDICTTVYIHHCQIRTRIDALAPVNTTSILVSEAVGGGGLFIGNHTGLTGAPGRSAGIRFTNENLWDTVILSGGSGMSGHDASIVKQVGAGGIANVTIGDFHFDACAYCVVIQPPTGSQLYTWQMQNVWAKATSSYIVADLSAGGTIKEIQVGNWRCTDAEGDGMVFGAGVNEVMVTNNRLISHGGSGAVGLKLGSGAGASHAITATGNQITMSDAASAASYSVGTGVTSAVVTGNLSIGKAGVFGPTPSAALIHANNGVI